MDKYLHISDSTKEDVRPVSSNEAGGAGKKLSSDRTTAKVFSRVVDAVANMQFSPDTKFWCKGSDDPLANAISAKLLKPTLSGRVGWGKVARGVWVVRNVSDMLVVFVCEGRRNAGIRIVILLCLFCFCCGNAK